MYSAIAANKRKSVMIMVVFALFAGGLAWLFGAAYQDYSITIIAGIFAVFYLIWGYFGSAKLALVMNGAHQIEKKDNPRLWRIVENLSITNGLPMPKVYVINDTGLNAFATGRDPDHSAVAVTTGLLNTLEDNELEGVMAHELGHVKNYDIRLSLIAFALVAVISLICDFFLRMSFFGRDNDNDNGGSSNIQVILMILALVAVIIAPFAASLMQLAISRKREYLADATGAMTTRYPEGLASALEKIKLHGSTVHRQNTSTAHLFFANPLKGKSFSALFSTHPPIEDRIKQLRGMTDKV
jgi:heat shock protein HtpX